MTPPYKTQNSHSTSSINSIRLAENIEQKYQYDAKKRIYYKNNFLRNSDGFIFLEFLHWNQTVLFLFKLWSLSLSESNTSTHIRDVATVLAINIRPPDWPQLFFHCRTLTTLDESNFCVTICVRVCSIEISHRIFSTLFPC